jgi:hypothetical protein
MLVVTDDGTESEFAPASGWFDWGWPSLGPTRRLARALLLDVTGREPPTEARDALATEELAHFPWAAFSLSAGELRGWIEARGYSIGDWPQVDQTPGRDQWPGSRPAERTLTLTDGTMVERPQPPHPHPGVAARRSFGRARGPAADRMR